MMITVFTPTYNRAHLLPRLYQSLEDQSCKDFEWLIVDDESKDDTETVVSKFCATENGVPIRYFKQPHGGKHRAINLAVQQAKGEFFFIVDSDDWLPEWSIETIKNWLESIRSVPKLCGVAGQKMLKDGAVVGKSFSSSAPVDATSIEALKLHISGDKAEVFSTEVLRNHPFPEFPDEFFVTEDVCWFSIAEDGFRLRWYQEPVYYCEYLEDGLTKTGANDLKGHMDNFAGYSYYVRQCLKLKNRQSSYHDFMAFIRTCDAMNLKWTERADALHWSATRLGMNQFLIYPSLYIFKRIVSFGKRLITNKRKTANAG